MPELHDALWQAEPDEAGFTMAEVHRRAERLRARRRRVQGALSALVALVVVASAALGLRPTDVGVVLDQAPVTTPSAGPAPTDVMTPPSPSDPGAGPELPGDLPPAAPVPAAAPDTWWGLHQDDTILTLDVGEVGQREVVATGDFGSIGGSEEQTVPPTVGDLTITAEGPVIGELSEPASGSIAVAEDGQLVRPDSSPAGLRVDGHPSGLWAWVDTHGFWSWAAGGEQQPPSAGAVDVAVSGQGLVAALIDPARALLYAQGAGPSLVLERASTGRIVQPLDVTPYCRIVWLRGAHILLLRGTDDAYVCTMDGADLYDAADASVTPVETLELDQRPARHVGVDDSGSYLIITGHDGAVRWATLDGRGGDLAAPGRYVAADW
ncbi:MAG TPA: hypothetical protein VMM13_16190 [Euzebya sp.]|nr:hypothetical protein [Euzebya sp.]